MTTAENIPCAVCGTRFVAGTEKYANSWEASLRQHPCCSEFCVGTFDASVHWMPSFAPDLLTEKDADRFISNLWPRIVSGENPGLVARDLLVAGVAPSRVERALNLAAAEESSAKRMVANTNRLGILSGLLTGHFFMFGIRGRGYAKVGAVLDAREEVDAWRRRFGDRPNLTT